MIWGAALELFAGKEATAVICLGNWGSVVVGDVVSGCAEKKQGGLRSHGVVVIRIGYGFCEVMVLVRAAGFAVRLGNLTWLVGIMEWFELNELVIACELVLFAGWGKVEL
ncbi:hypothetical protein M0R45_001952 [Rubus argutus]|uniref:NADH dehydrogenase subunit 6 n=1 Tax=Rubus argutus TaxID=59490 RepID=A0AAW1VGA2_RUBAR